MARLKPRYNHKPTAKEKAFHIWLMNTFPCACGCGRTSTIVHHPLTRHPHQRWRRDHEYVVPLNWLCHTALHARGCETREFEGMVNRAADFRQKAIEEGRL